MNFKTFVFFFIFVYAGFDVYTQKIDETIKYADKLFENGDYNKSLSLYLRVAFFSTKPNVYLFEKSGDCQFQSDDFISAESYYDSALFYCEDEYKYTELLYKKADCKIFRKDFDDAVKFLKGIDFEYLQYSEQYHFYLGIAFFGQEDFKLSETQFLLCLPDSDFFAKNQILEIFDKNYNYPNPQTAYVLSSVIPGLGQLYSGNYREALNSFVLVAAIVLLANDMYMKFGLADSVISIFPWLNRYFNGGIENAEKIAEMERNNRRNQILNRIILILQNYSNQY